MTTGGDPKYFDELFSLISITKMERCCSQNFHLCCCCWKFCINVSLGENSRRFCVWEELGFAGPEKGAAREFSWKELSGACNPQAQRYPKPELFTELTRLEKAIEIIKSKTSTSCAGLINYQ